MNKFKFKSIVIIYFIPFAFFISQGCRTLKNNTEDVPSCAGSTASIWVSGVLEETAQIGTINIPIGYQICSEYRGGWITLFIVRPGGDGISSMKWDIPTDNPSTGTQYFEYKFIAIGEYEIYAELHPNNNQSGKMPIRTSLSFFINITASPNRIVYPIIQLETRAWRPIGYQVQELWPKRFDANNNQVYFGQFKRDSVFNSANVSFT